MLYKSMSHVIYQSPVPLLCFDCDILVVIPGRPDNLEDQNCYLHRRENFIYIKWSFCRNVRFSQLPV
jgi:hypothetical protein